LRVQWMFSPMITKLEGLTGMHRPRTDAFVRR
jgi:hypothetical protein